MVKALQALRGIDQISAIGVVAEIGDIGRFAHPRQLMAYLGLVPSEYSSSDRVVRASDAHTIKRCPVQESRPVEVLSPKTGADRKMMMC